MLSDEIDLAAITETLSLDYRVLRRLTPRTEFDPCDGLSKVGILFDVETTGLNTALDEVIELAM